MKGLSYTPFGTIAYFLGEKVLISLANETGCRRCMVKDKCARFEVKSKYLPFHELCGSIYRTDMQSVVFIAIKD